MYTEQTAITSVATTPADTKCCGLEHDQAYESLCLLRRRQYETILVPGKRGDALFELTDALLCRHGKRSSLVELCLEPEFRRGHGGLYDVFTAGDINPHALRDTLASNVIPIYDPTEGRVLIAVDGTGIPRPAAATSDGRVFINTATLDGSKKVNVPSYGIDCVGVIAPDRGAMIAPLDFKLKTIGVTANQNAATLAAAALIRLNTHASNKDDIHQASIVLDREYDPAYVFYEILTNPEVTLPTEVIARVRDDRVFYGDAPQRPPGYIGPNTKHGSRIELPNHTRGRKPRGGETPKPSGKLTRTAGQYGQVTITYWNRVHPRLTRRGAWSNYPADQKLPVIAGTLVLAETTRTPKGGKPMPMWLWCSTPNLDAFGALRVWRDYRGRFAIEHFFRYTKQDLLWTIPKTRGARKTELWTSIVFMAFDQIRMASGIDGITGRRWHTRKRKPNSPATPYQARTELRNILSDLPKHARVPQVGRAGPGRPPGSKNKELTVRYPVGYVQDRTLESVTTG